MSQIKTEPVNKIVSYDEAFGCVKTAVRKTALYFETKGNSRGKVIMPCGSGKTLFSCFLAVRELRPDRIIITVPNLLLEEQSFRVFHSQLSGEDYKFICIGSDKDIAQGLGEQIQVTTSSEEITAFLSKNFNKKIIMLATYQSMDAVCYSCQDIDFKFNLGIIDEAHRTVGGEDKMFSKILFDENIQIDKRLFMTATEKVYNGKKDEIIGMNNKEHYGETIYNYSLADAIEKDGVLCDYEINEMYTSDNEVFEFIKSNSYLDYENIDLTDEDKQGLLCALLGTIQAIKEKGCRKIVTYHSTIKKATIFKELLDKIIGNKMLDMGVFHVNGKQPIGYRVENMKEFQSSFISVLTNSQALVEGIDIPCIDAIVFSDKKESAVQIVQAVGRALRKYEGKNKVHIIVPILTSSTGEVGSSDFSGLLSILIQMAMQDERLLHEITRLTEQENIPIIENKILKSNIPFDNQLKEKLLKFNKSIRLRIVQRLTELAPYDKAVKWVVENCIPVGIDAGHKWFDFTTGRKEHSLVLPTNIPKAPNTVYKNKGWDGWDAWFGREKIVWSKEKCIKDAKKYKSRKEWRKKSSSAYSSAYRNGWLEECCRHMIRLVNKIKRFTKELCIKDANKYKTRTEWFKKSQSAYSKAWNNGWLEECCKHMGQKMKPPRYWTKEKCIEDAKKYKTRAEWNKANSYACYTAWENGWRDECCKHMEEKMKPKNYWTKQHCIEDAQKYKTKMEWKEKSPSGYGKAYNKNWLPECCKHMDVINKPHGYWTKKQCAKDAKKYKSISEWKRESGSGYAIAYANNWLDKCCKHMARRRKK
jgi:superfamily II DNA or RNA helicase